MYTFELMDKVDQILGSLCANFSIIDSESIREKVDELDELLNNIRESILAELTYNRHNQW